jgi:hypothetical protein
MGKGEGHLMTCLYRHGREAISNPFATSSPEESCSSAPRYGRFISTEDTVPIKQEAGFTSRKFWTVRKISSPPGLGMCHTKLTYTNFVTDFEIILPPYNSNVKNQITLLRIVRLILSLLAAVFVVSDLIMPRLCRILLYITFRYHNNRRQPLRKMISEVIYIKLFPKLRTI